MKKMFVVPIEHGRFELRDGSESMYGGKAVAYGSKEACEATARLMSPGNWKLITCVTPNGRIDSHGKYIYGRPGQPMVCNFCRK